MFSTVTTFVGKCEAPAKEHQPKRILFISSYSPNFSTFGNQVQGIADEFADENIELDIEFMDSKRFYTEENIENFHVSLTYKIEKLEPYDAIIVADDNGLAYVRQQQDTLFKGIPIVFLGINNLNSAINASKNPLITGVVEAISLEETIEVATRLKEDATRVVALSDNTISGQGDLVSFYELAGNFRGLEFEDLDLSDYTFQEYAEELQKLTENDIVILLSVYRDKDDVTLTFKEGLQVVLDNSTQPVFHPYLPGLGDGLLGGKVISHYDQARSAAGIVKRVFHGEDISTIPLVDESPNKYIFDLDVIKTYKLDKSVLPMDTRLLNEKMSFIRENPLIVIGVTFIFLIQSTIIVILELNKKRRKLAEKQLRLSKDEVDKANEELQSTNEVLTATNEELLAALEEISEQDQKIYELIYMDTLTELKNRFAITQAIDQALNFGKVEGLIAIMFIDVDNFKNINDTYGHDMGDEVIKHTAARLRKFINDNVHIGRFGGDEFLVLVKEEEMAPIYELVKAIQEVFNDPIEVGECRFFLTVSIGVAMYPENGKTRRELVKKADMALYKAKEAGKNTCIFFCNEMDTQMENKMILQSAIKEALKNKEFYLLHQPYVDAHEHRVLGVESLIRWKSDKLGFVSPFDLIINAEEMGLIGEIGEWVLKESCLLAKRLNEKSKQSVTVSVNVSALQLMNKDFVERTMAIIHETGVDPSWICLEMTETILIESLEAGGATINELESNGIKIALDDFGTGYSSLRYFKDLPASVLKIDKSFIDNIAKNPYDFYLVDAMVNIAHMKGIKVVAEGVETEEQLKCLQKIKCDYIQGYLFSRPLDEDNLKFFLDWWS